MPITHAISVSRDARLKLVTPSYSPNPSLNKEMNQSELDKPFRVTRKFLEPSCDDCIICLRLEMISGQQEVALIITQHYVTIKFENNAQIKHKI